MTPLPITLLIPMVVVLLSGTTDSASCVAGTFKAGQPGQLSCQFDQDISAGQLQIIVHHYLSEEYDPDTSSTILDKCNWASNRLSCSKPPDGFVFDNTVRVTNRLTINIPQVQSSMQGVYTCDIVGDSMSPTPCNLTVIEASTTTPDPAAPTPEPITKLPGEQMPSGGDPSQGTTIGIIILAIVLAVVVVLFTCCLLVMRCKYRMLPRNKKDPTDSEKQDSWNDIICCRPLNACVYKKESETGKATYNIDVGERDPLRGPAGIEENHDKSGSPGGDELGLNQGVGPAPPSELAPNHDGPSAVNPAPPNDLEGTGLNSKDAAPRPNVQVAPPTADLKARDESVGQRGADSSAEGQRSAGSSKEDQPPTPQPPGGSGKQSECLICRDPITNPKSLSCGHTFCTACIDAWLEQKATCPNCNKIVGTLLGNQPEDGTMAMTYSKEALLGYGSVGSFIIKYHFQAGRQKDNHPTPGKRYDATERLAYLPDTEEGRKVLMLLRIAFDRRLTFTIGQSLTSGSKVEGIIWNDIHHKTFRKGGQAQYGYPDKGYLARVQEDLTKKGVTEADLTKTHRDFIRDPQSVCLTYNADSNQDFSAVFSG